MEGKAAPVTGGAAGIGPRGSVGSDGGEGFHEDTLLELPITIPHPTPLSLTLDRRPRRLCADLADAARPRPAKLASSEETHGTLVPSTPMYWRLR